MANQLASRLPAWQTIILAALDCQPDGREHFNEWELSVAAWRRDARLFGMRGYSDRHPDHKRVYTEMLGAVRRGFVKKTRANHYTLTPIGRAEAARSIGRSRNSRTLNVDHYEAVKDFALSPIFLRWRDDPEYPADWDTATKFLRTGYLQRSAPGHAAAWRAIGDACRAALKWCNAMNVVYLTGVGKAPAPIRYGDVADVLSFLSALAHRFPELAT
jgi:hypothetical protein